MAPPSMPLQILSINKAVITSMKLFTKHYRPLFTMNVIQSNTSPAFLLTPKIPVNGSANLTAPKALRAAVKIAQSVSQS